MTHLKNTHPGTSVRAQAQELVDHHGTLRAAATAVGIACDTIHRVIRFPQTTVQESTYQAIIRAHTAMERDYRRIDGATVAGYAETAEGRSFIAECRGAV